MLTVLEGTIDRVRVRKEKTGCTLFYNDDVYQANEEFSLITCLWKEKPEITSRTP